MPTRFEPTLKPLKRQWSISTPRYDVFYQVDALLQVLVDAPVPTGEEKIRNHLILLLRLLCLFRGIDLARCHNAVQIKQGVYFLPMRRKGQTSFSFSPVPEVQPPLLNPRLWLGMYIALVEKRGPWLFWTLPGKGPSRPLSADAIIALTSKF